MLEDPKFIPLRVHSDFSIIDGLNRPKDIVKAAAALGYPALALTDATNLFGWLQFSSTAFQYGVKPICGVDLLVKNLSSQLLGRVTLLARNEEGYRAILSLITKVCTCSSGIKEKAIFWQELSPYREHLFFISGGFDGWITRVAHEALISPEITAELNDIVDAWKGALFIEIQRVGALREEENNAALLSLAEKTETCLVATHPTYFISKDHYYPHQVRVAIQKGIRVTDKTMSETEYGQEHYLHDQESIAKKFSDLPQALRNSVEIAKRCSIFPKKYKPALPKIETANCSNEVFLQNLAWQGLTVHLQEMDQGATSQAVIEEYKNRLEYELGVIESMGFASYFLVVHEFIQWSKLQDIPVGPGRGSGAGSLVAYSLGITEIDPIRFQLLFERFLNDARVSLPDFDIDFCPKERERVIQHVIERYGKDSVAQIATFGTMMARGVIRDVGRALGHPYGFVDKVAKLVPFELGMTLENALHSSPPLKALYDEDEEVAGLFKIAKVLEGAVRNVGKHAGGIVIAPEPLEGYTPLMLDAEEKNFLTQFSKDDLETIGLVKFDFLGLKTLTIIQRALQSICQYQISAGSEPLSLKTIPLNDQKALEFLRSGQTAAIFQLESRGMRELVLKLAPDSFEEIIALVALYRPGPLQSGMVDNFINRKHGREICAYPEEDHQHPCLEPILKETYGIILYQEQAMQIAQVLAGYSLSEADILRRVIGKKKAHEMLQQRERFAQGAERQGIDAELAKRIFDLVEKFSGYAFNKSHSAAYALVTYHTLYLKTHFPAHFMAAVLSSDLDQTDKLSEMIDESRRLGLIIQNPCVNGSALSFDVVDNQTISFGLGAIKGLGARSIAAILQAKGNQPFTNFANFLTRISLKEVGKSAIEKLIMAGAFDCLESNRALLMHTLPDWINWAEAKNRVMSSGQQGFFGFELEHAPQNNELFVHKEIRDWSSVEKLQQEYEALGYYLSGNPLTHFEQEFSAQGITIDFDHLNHTSIRNNTVKFPIIIQKINLKRTKRGDAFAVLSGLTNREKIEVVVSFEILETAKTFCKVDTVLIVEGTIKREAGTKSLRSTAQILSDWRTLRWKKITGLNFNWSEPTEENALQKMLGELKRLKQHLLTMSKEKRHAFSIYFTVLFSSGKALWRLGNEYHCALSEEDLNQILQQCPSLDRVELRTPAGWVLFEPIIKKA